MNILEFACGTGCLAKYFVDSMYMYTGMDNSEEMLKIARETVPNAHFIRGDMRKFKIHQIFDAVIINGNSFAHMIENGDVAGCLESAYNALKPKGLFIFDTFNASYIFTHFEPNTGDTYEIGDTTITRASTSTPNLTTGWTWQWDTQYYIIANGVKRIVDDSMLLRAFTRDEIDLWLQYCNFKLVNVENFEMPHREPFT